MKRLSCILTFMTFLLGALPVWAANYTESTFSGGDYSDDPFNPSYLGDLDLGTNTISGTVGDDFGECTFDEEEGFACPFSISISDPYDAFSVSLQPGHEVLSISYDPSPSLLTNEEALVFIYSGGLKKTCFDDPWCPVLQPNSFEFQCDPGADACEQPIINIVNPCGPIDVTGGTFFEFESCFISNRYDWTVTIDVGKTAPVPLPATMPLVGLGLLALGFVGRRKKRDLG